MKSKTAKIFLSGGSQAVRLPVEFRFNVAEVFIRKEGEEVILSVKPVKPESWDRFFEAEMKVTSDFRLQHEGGTDV